MFQNPIVENLYEIYLSVDSLVLSIIYSTITAIRHDIAVIPLQIMCIYFNRFHTSINNSLTTYLQKIKQHSNIS